MSVEYPLLLLLYLSHQNFVGFLGETPYAFCYICADFILVENIIQTVSCFDFKFQIFIARTQESDLLLCTNLTSWHSSVIVYWFRWVYFLVSFRFPRWLIVSSVNHDKLNFFFLDLLIPLPCPVSFPWISCMTLNKSDKRGCFLTQQKKKNSKPLTIMLVGTLSLQVFFPNLGSYLVCWEFLIKT